MRPLLLLLALAFMIALASAIKPDPGVGATWLVPRNRNSPPPSPGSMRESSPTQRPMQRRKTTVTDAELEAGLTARKIVGATAVAVLVFVVV